MTRINFIVPIKHPSLISDPVAFVALLGRTLASIGRQEGETRAMICASPSTPLPPLPAGVELVEVDRPPPPPNPQASLDDHYRAIRTDKGARVRAGFARIEDPAELVMVVDDDDIVHQDLARHIHRHDDGRRSGYVVRDGYMHRVADGTFVQIRNFHQICGTSLIIRKDRYLRGRRDLPHDHRKIMAELGSHKIMPKRLDALGEPLQPVQFAAAIYCVGGANSSQRSIGARFGEALTTDVRAMRKARLLAEVEERIVRREFPVDDL